MKWVINHWAIVLIAGATLCVALPTALRSSTARQAVEVHQEEDGQQGKISLRRGGSGRPRPQSAKQAVKVAVDSLGKKPKPKRRKKEVDFFSEFKGIDREQVETLQSALDGAGVESDNVDEIIANATVAAQSRNPEVRLCAVEALGWVGFEALPELTDLMMDPNEDVAEAARDKWEQALEEDEDAVDRFKIAVAALETIENADSLSTLGMILFTTATEIVDNEEDETAAAQLRLEVVQSLVDIIDAPDGNPQNVAAAKEAYEDFTGEEWNGVDAAEEYLFSEYDYATAAHDDQVTEGDEDQADVVGETDDELNAEASGGEDETDEELNAETSDGDEDK